MQTSKIFINSLIHCIDSVPFYIFIMMNVADIITGFLKASINKEPRSTTASKGIMKHLAEIFGVLVVSTAFGMLNQPEYGAMVIMAMYAVEAISLIGNLHAIGVPMPDWLVEFFGDIKDRKPSGKDDLNGQH